MSSAIIVHMIQQESGVLFRCDVRGYFSIVVDLLHCVVSDVPDRWVVAFTENVLLRICVDAAVWACGCFVFSCR